MEGREDREASKRELELMQEVFAHVGWRTIVAAAEAEVENLVIGLEYVDPESLRFFQGQIHQLRQLINLEDVIDMAYNELINEPVSDDADV